MPCYFGPGSTSCGIWQPVVESTTHSAHNPASVEVPALVPRVAGLEVETFRKALGALAGGAANPMRLYLRRSLRVERRC